MKPAAGARKRTITPPAPRALFHELKTPGSWMGHGHLPAQGVAAANERRRWAHILQMRVFLFRYHWSKSLHGMDEYGYSI